MKVLGRITAWLNQVFGLGDIRRLTFAEDELERGYRAYETEIQRRTFRRACILGSFAVSVFAISDILLFEPVVTAQLLRLRLVASNLVLFGGLALSFHPLFERYSRFITGGVTVGVGLCIWAMLYAAPAPHAELFYVGIVMTMFFDAFIYGGCWTGFAISSAVLYGAYLIGALFLFDLSAGARLVSIMFMSVTAGVCLAASFAREDNLRKAFALGESLRVQRDRVTENNVDLERRVADRMAEAVALNASLQQELVSRQKAETELASERDLLSSVFDAMNDIVVVFDPVSRQPLRWNRAVREVTGHTNQEIQEQRIPSDWLSPEDRAQLNKVLATTQLSGRSAVTITIPHKDGSQTPVEFVATMLQPADGGPHLAILLGRNLSERQRAQLALRTSRERLELALNSANMGIWEYDWRTQWLMIDRRCVELLGVRSGSLFEVIQQLGAHVPRQSAQRLAELFRDHLAEGRDRFDIEYPYVLDGTHSWISMSGGVAERGPDGVPTRTVGLLRDSSDRHRLDDRIRETAKLEAIGRLAGGVAHDFNNLLTVINGYGELALMDLDTESEIHEMLQAICEQGKRAAGLTRQLLTFSRREPMDLQPLDLDAVIQELGRMLRRLIGEDIELVLAPADALPPIEADQTQLEQVIMNLAVNARDAMPNGGTLTISAQLTRVDQGARLRLGDLSDGNYVELTVTDTGHGMDSETLDHLFEPFYTTKPQGEGTGLGLAVVYGVMERLNGGIDVQSTVDEGTTFRLLLPLATSALVAAKSQEPGVSKGDETILLVEDEHAVRSLVRRMLQQMGYQVHEASSGPEAMDLALALDTPIDLLLTDVVMPRMTGPVLAEKLVAHWPDLRVLYMTGYNNVLADERLDERYRLLTKPIAQSALSQALRELLDPH